MWNGETDTPASEPSSRSINVLFRFGLINDVYYVCKLRGLSAFSGERDSLLRCVGGDGEAGASDDE